MEIFYGSGTFSKCDFVVFFFGGGGHFDLSNMAISGPNNGKDHIIMKYWNQKAHKNVVSLQLFVSFVAKQQNTVN